MEVERIIDLSGSAQSGPDSIRWGYIPKLPPVKVPEPGTKVRAIIKHRSRWELQVAALVAPDWGDSDWKFLDDGSELPFMQDVVYWEPLEEGGESEDLIIDSYSNLTCMVVDLDVIAKGSVGHIKGKEPKTGKYVVEFNAKNQGHYRIDQLFVYGGGN